MDDIKELFRENFLRYASYVILDRAIPDLVDGLKPVQRRILWTLFMMEDGKLHKVANVAGQTMALHPHGDAPIIEALVNLANKDFLLDKQGNFGNPSTGDPAAASRYIETRLNPLAKKTLFNEKLTTFSPSYDGRKMEPKTLPAKIPILLMQGAEGIAVGMSTKILPHNFSELLEAQITLLEGGEIKLLPDFPSGGSVDASDYRGGKGKVKVRATIEIVDDKTLVIKEICYGTTTESTIRSIDEAAKKGKIKIDSINDYTAERIEIEIKLPRGQYAQEVIEGLYAFTDCEVTLHPQMVVIKDESPWEASAEEILQEHLKLLLHYLKEELEIEKREIFEKIFRKMLEKIFIENRLYKVLEELKSVEKIHSTLADKLLPFIQELSREPTREDREFLLQLPIRRISLFDREKNADEMRQLLKRLEEIERDLKNMKKCAIRYLQALLGEYKPFFPRKTKIRKMQEVDVKELEKRKVKVGYDPEGGYLGLKVAQNRELECLNVDKLLLLYENGAYLVIPIPEKRFVHTGEAKLAYMGVADKKTLFTALYIDQETSFPYIKRFIVDKFIQEKLYRFLPEGTELVWLGTQTEGKIEIEFKKGRSMTVDIAAASVKGVSAKGVRLAKHIVKKVGLK